MKHDTSDKLTLYMIGHAPDAGYLKRLIDGVRPIIRGIAFVNTDETDTCRKVLEDSGIPFAYAKLTYSDRSRFNFSECRNMAMDLAEKSFGGWLVWLDCDDVIEHPELILSTMQANPGADCYALPYDVSPDFDNVWKMRIHRHQGFRWQRKIHEELIPKKKNPKIVLMKDIPVKHMPDKSKSNHDFHISLLEQEADQDPNALAYLAKEHFNRNRHAECLKWAGRVISEHPIESEVYQAQLTAGLCHIALENSQAALHIWHDAIKTDPTRREAYYYIAETLAQQGGESTRKALGYAAACNAQIDRRIPGQNRNVYFTAGYKLHALIMLEVGYIEQAHEIIHRCKDFDDEAKQITLKIESRLLDAAIKQRDAA